MKRLKVVLAYEFDVVRLKADPTKYVHSLSDKLLRQLYRRAKTTYYSGSPFLSDAEFDIIEDIVRERMPDHNLFQKVGAPIEREKKVKLPFYMGSLDKIKPNTGDLDKWLSNHQGSCVVADKLDGVSLLITCNQGVYRLYTRGNGAVGQDITVMLPMLNLPKTTETFAVRAELIMSDLAFNKYAKNAENPRNFMSGLITRKTISPALKDANVICYELISPRKKPSDQLNYLKNTLGFTIAPAKLYNFLDDDVLSKRFIARKKLSKFRIDGLVVTANRAHKRPVTGNPEYSFAFKMTLDDQTAKVRVISINWNVSKNGLLKPTVVVNPIRLGGVTIRRVTGFNAKFIVDNKIGVGSILRIVRSGDVIPHILETLKPSREPGLPDLDYEWTSSRVDIKAVGRTDTQLVKQIAWFFFTIGVENFAQGTVQRLVDNGINSIHRIIRANKQTLMSVPGIQDRTATIIVTGIKKALNPVSLPVLMAASSAFGPGFGIKQLTPLIRRYPNIMDLNSLDSNKLVQMALSITGFSDKRAHQFAIGFPKFVSFTKRIKGLVTVEPFEEVDDVHKGSMVGEIVLFTGFRDKDLEARIEQEGGHIANGFSRKVTILVVRLKGTGSTKERRAIDLGITILTKEGLVSEFELDL